MVTWLEHASLCCNKEHLLTVLLHFITQPSRHGWALSNFHGLELWHDVKEIKDTYLMWPISTMQSILKELMNLQSYLIPFPLSLQNSCVWLSLSLQHYLIWHASLSRNCVFMVVSTWGNSIQLQFFLLVTRLEPTISSL